jgi:hypothetical protein
LTRAITASSTITINSPAPTGYGNGDFNFDGVIDAGDYGLIDNSFQLQGAPISTNGSPFAIMAVPEPSSALVIGLAAATFLPRAPASPPSAACNSARFPSRRDRKRA